MNALEAIKKELQKHQAKLVEFQAELYDVEQTIQGLQGHQQEVKNKVVFEGGVIQSLEFTISIIEQGQKPEDK